MKVKFLILSAIFMLAIPKVPYGQCVCVSIVENRETDFRDANGECYNYVKYIPNENSAVLNVKINLHFFRNDDGTGVYQPEDYGRVLNMVSWVNSIYRNLADPTITPETSVDVIYDSKVSFKIMNIYYHDDSNVYNANNAVVSDVIYHQYGEHNESEINIFFFNDSSYNVGVGAGCASFVNMANISLDSWAHAQLLAHELGHSLGLNHPWEDNLDDTYFPDDNRDWLPCNNVNISNNIMGYNICRNYLSPMQLGVIHRNILCNIERMKYILCGEEETLADIHLNQDEVYDHCLLLDKEIIIESGTTLSTLCKVYCTPSARIIIHPGGRLVIDGGTLTSACEGTMWEGIFVEGDRAQPQHASLQGVVELRNGATIENARCAITTSSPDGNMSTTGGIILAEDATFRNNAQAIRFLPYADYVSTNTIRPSYSQFKNCIFTIDENNHFATANTDFGTHVSLWDVTGIKFLGCTFENNADATVNRGRAIYTENAGCTVKTQCDMPSDLHNDCECPADYADYNTFSGFATAIDANTTGNSYAITIDGARFSNNGTGILLNSTNYATVTRCDFDLSNSPVSTMRNITGLILKTCTGFKVEGNLFHQNATSLAVTKRGIVASETGTGANSIYRNSFSNLSNGIYVVGNNGSLRNGLQFSCNTFENNNRDVNMTTSSTLSYSQGGPLKGADNTFSGTQDCSITLSSGASMNYYRSSGTNLNPYNPSTNLHLYAALPNGCASTLCSNDQISMVNASDRVRAMMQDSLVDLSALKDVFKNMHELNARYSLAEVLHQMDIDNLTTLFSLSDDLTEDADKAEYENYMTFNGTKMKYWPEATSEQIELLRNIAENNTGRSSEMAKSVLCFFFGECYEEELLEENNVRSISKNTQRNWVYWVPAPAEPVIFPLQQRTVMDTILLDRPCVVTDFILRDESWHQYDVILSEDSERTFFYDPVLGSFKLLYDFTLRQGDQYAVYPTIGSMSDSLVVTIDSVGSEWIDGVMLRVQYAHDQYYAQQNGQSFTYRWTFGNHTASPFKIMERVGSDYYFVPQEVAFGDIITKGLCSYVDDAILYQTNDTMDCSQPYTYDIESHSTMECKVWPNPVANTLSVSSEECLANVRMYDIYGKLLQEIEIQGNDKTDINMSMLSEGIYLLEITLKNGSALTKKIIKTK